MGLPDWYKIKGYYHVSPPSKGKWRDSQLNIRKISNPKFVSKYAFFPLLHTNLKDRRYKQHPFEQGKRVHSYFDKKKGKFERTTKVRPLHYANHFDALIFGYYASILQIKYDKLLSSIEGLSDCVTAYRKIEIPNSEKNKGTIHFAHEAFSEIKCRALQTGEVSVLAFDIKSFFPSLDHLYLKEKWMELMEFSEMPKDHQTVLNGATKFSFIYRDDLRRNIKRKGNRRANFDERKLAEISNRNGFSAFFESPKDFREHIRNGEIRVYQNSFRNKKNEVIGIPQGLPISAILANLYLIDFDKSIFQELVKNKNCFYRRYSDDIVIVCDSNLVDEVQELVDIEMSKCHVTLSKEKTEEFIFRRSVNGVVCSKITKSGERINLPLIYLGFEFYGNKTLIKSANLSKFYRRMIYAVKSKAKIAINQGKKNHTKPILYKNQLYKIYRNINLDKSYTPRRFKSYIRLDNGEYRISVSEFKKSFRGNYFSYAKRAAEIMDEPAILKQIEGEKRVFNQAIQRHFKDKIE